MRGALLVAALFVAALLACRATTSDVAPTRTSKHVDDACAQCHIDDFNATTHPMHAGKKPTQCDVCHTQDDWHPSRLSHEWWLIDGAHAKAECFDCHKGEPTVFSGTPNKCVSCHRDAEHQANVKLSWHEDLGPRCYDCHTTSAWDPPDPSYHETPHDTDAGAPMTDAAVGDASFSDAASPVVIVKPHPTVRPHPTTTPSTTPSTVPSAVPTIDPDVISHPSRHRVEGPNLAPVDE